MKITSGICRNASTSNSLKLPDILYKKKQRAKEMESAKKYNSKLCGIFLVIGGIASALLSKDNGCYDITAALFLVPLGLAMIFCKAE